MSDVGAAQVNGWHSILAIEHDGDAELASLIENLQRVDLSAVEETKGLQRLINGKGWSQADAARLLGKSKAVISGLLRILSLPDSVLNAVIGLQVPIPKNALVELARVKNPRAREKLIALARAGELTIRAIRHASKETAHNSAAPTGRQAKQPASKRLELNKVIEQLLAQLRAARQTELTLEGSERSSLLELKTEIEKLLAGAT